MPDVAHVPSWSTLLPDLGLVAQVVVAIVLGGLIGIERELRDKPAGFRTIVLICVGACIFTIVSDLSGGLDQQRTRIAAQIVSGIGFLGAGAILRDRASVLGMTTAATIWAVAAIGVAVGFGHFALATLGTLSILVALLIFDFVEQWIGDRRDIQEYHIETPNTEDALDRMGAMFADSKLKTRKRYFHQSGDALMMHIIAMGAKSDHDRLRTHLVQAEQYTLHRE